MLPSYSWWCLSTLSILLLPRSSLFTVTWTGSSFSSLKGFLYCRYFSLNMDFCGDTQHCASAYWQRRLDSIREASQSFPSSEPFLGSTWFPCALVIPQINETKQVHRKSMCRKVSDSKAPNGSKANKCLLNILIFQGGEGMLHLMASWGFFENLNIVLCPSLLTPSKTRYFNTSPLNWHPVHPWCRSILVLCQWIHFQSD